MHAAIRSHYHAAAVYVAYLQTPRISPAQYHIKAQLAYLAVHSLAVLLYLSRSDL